MSKDNLVTQKDIDEAKVSFKPIFGIKPGHYLAGLFVLIILLAFFAIFFLPGLVNPGTNYRFVTDPIDAAIFVDGKYYGYSPSDVYLKKGSREVTIERVGFKSYLETIQVKRNAFASIFGANRQIIDVKLEIEDAQKAIDYAYKDFCLWSLSGTAAETWQIPLILSEACSALSSKPNSFDSSYLLGASLSASNISASGRDALRASFISYTNSTALTPLTMNTFVNKLIKEIEKDPSILISLMNMLSKEDRAKIENSSFISNYLKENESKIKEQEQSQSSNKYNSTNVVKNPSGLESGKFTYFKAGKAIIKAKGYPDTCVDVKPFSLAKRETTVGEYRKFLQDNPEWDVYNKDKLIEQGLVSKDYLKNFSAYKDSDVLCYVSKAAAMAYCSYLSENSQHKYRLPSEAEWAYASSFCGQTTYNTAVLSSYAQTIPPKDIPLDEADLSGMLGNVWEWTSDSFAQNPSAGIEGRKKFISSESVVRSACWANRSDLVTLDSRGAIPNNECTAYLGFRIAVEQE